MKSKKGKKRWTEEKVSKSLSKISKQRPTEYQKASNRIIYWMVLLVLTISNFMVAVLLIPFLLIISTFKFYLIVMLLALVFGLFFDLLIRDIEHLETKHHVFAAIFIPVIAVINLFLMIRVANRLAYILKMTVIGDPVMTSFVYVLIFVLPYMVNILREEFKK